MRKILKNSGLSSTELPRCVDVQSIRCTRRNWDSWIYVVLRKAEEANVFKYLLGSYRDSVARPILKVDTESTRGQGHRLQKVKFW